MPTTIYTLPGSDIDVTVEFDIKRSDDLVLVACYIDEDREMETDKLFVADEAYAHQGMRHISLSTYFQRLLNDDAAGLIIDNQDSGSDSKWDDRPFAEAAE